MRELRAALEDAAEAICRVDTDGRVVSVNRAFCPFFGYTPDEIIGRSWEVAVSAADRPLIRADLRMAADKVDREVHGARKDGTPFDMQLAVVPVIDGSAKPAQGPLHVHPRPDRSAADGEPADLRRAHGGGGDAGGRCRARDQQPARLHRREHRLRPAPGRRSRRASRAAAPHARDDVGHTLDEVGEALAEAPPGRRAGAQHRPRPRVFSRGDEEQSGPGRVRRVLESSISMAWNEIRHRARLVKDYGDTPWSRPTRRGWARCS